MIQPKDIPAAWRALLADVQAICPGAVLAGGSIRDLDNDRPVKDLDIFMPSGGNTRGVTDMLRARGYEQTKYFDCGYRNVDHTIEDVSTFEKVGETPIGIIRMSKTLTTNEWLSRFDFGLCQIAFDGEIVIRTAAYVADQARAQFTVMRSDTQGQFDRSVTRHRRLAAKYDGWPMVVPLHFLPLQEAHKNGSRYAL